jgi:hypothetical protein
MESTPLLLAQNQIPFVERKEVKRCQISSDKIVMVLLLIVLPILALAVYVAAYSSSSSIKKETISSDLPLYTGAWRSEAEPFSVVNPEDLGIISITRPLQSRPGAIFDKILAAKKRPLPTNSWLQNLFIGTVNNGSNNRGILQYTKLTQNISFLYNSV